MKKLLGIFMCAMMLAGCGASSAASAPEESKAPAPEVFEAFEAGDQKGYTFVIKPEDGSSDLIIGYDGSEALDTLYTSLKEAVADAAFEEIDGDSVSEDDLKYDIILNNGSKSIFYVYADGTLKTVANLGERHFYSCDKSADILAACDTAGKALTASAQ